MRPRTLGSGIAILLACALGATACSSSAMSGTSTAATTTTAGAHLTAAACHRPHKAGQFAQSFTFQGKARTYQLFVPKAYTGAARVPVVFNFHGYGSNAVEEMVYADFKPQAQKNNFLIVAPDGQDGGGRHWSFSEGGGFQNDVTMVSALLKRIEGQLCVDATRVYSTGMSDGGAMTSVLACTSADKFAAFAAVAVVVYCGTSNGRVVPIESFAGSKDPVVPTNGGKVTCCGNPTLPSKASTTAKWAAHNACNAKFTDARITPHVVRRTWSGCKGGSATVYYLVVGDGHTWPGAIPVERLGHTTNEIKASDIIWKFFAGHKLAR